MTSHDGPKVPSPYSFTVANELLGGLREEREISFRSSPGYVVPLLNELPVAQDRSHDLICDLIS